MIPQTGEEWAGTIFFVVWMVLMLRLLYKDFKKEREMNNRSGSETRQRAKNLGLRLSDEEFSSLEKRAQESGASSVQEYIRWQLFSDAPMP